MADLKYPINVICPECSLPNQDRWPDNLCQLCWERYCFREWWKKVEELPEHYDPNFPYPESQLGPNAPNLVEQYYTDPVLRALELACKDLALANDSTVDENVLMEYVSKYLLDAVNEIARKIRR